MNTCGPCGVPVRQVSVGSRMVLVDAEPHPAGIYAVRTVRHSGHTTALFYGYRLGRDEAPRPGHSRHRVHTHTQGD